MTEWFREVFGGWQNFTQGAGGAFFGVVGAYVIALLTVRAEVRRERERFKEVAGIEAAGRLVRVVVDLPERLRSVRLLQVTGSSGIDYKHVRKWDGRRDNLRDEIAEHGALLPRFIEDEALRLVGLLGNLFSVDADDEHHILIWVEAASEEVIEDVASRAERILHDLQDYRRDPSSVRERSKSGGRRGVGGVAS